MTTREMLTLHQIAQAACDHWSALLQQAFGKRAGDARYDQRGKSTPELAAARNAFHIASEALQAEWAKSRAFSDEG